MWQWGGLGFSSPMSACLGYWPRLAEWSHEIGYYVKCSLTKTLWYQTMIQLHLSSNKYLNKIEIKML